MVDVSNRVFTNVETYVHQTFPSVDCQNVELLISPKFPAMSVRQIDMPEVALDLDPGSLDQEFAVNSNVEIQVFSINSITEARSIISLACDAMRGMGYTRRYGATEIRDTSRPNLFRMVARFSRIVSSLDEIPKFSQ